MSIVLDLTPNEEASLATLPRRGGVALEEMAGQLVRLGLELEQVVSPRDRVLAKIHQWQKEMGTTTLPRVSGRELFSRWAQEDAHMSEEEEQRETQLWQEIEKGVRENHTAL